ncbi:MAG: ATPase domain-containing protein [Sulfolobales archaeon]
MMSFESLFGLASLDSCIKTSSRNHLVFIVGSSGSGKSLLIKNSVAVHLRSGRGAIAVLLDEDMESFLDGLTQIIPSKIVLEALSSRKLRIVDTLSSRGGYTTMKKEEWDLRTANPSNPTSIVDVVRIMLEEMRSSNIETVVIIDSLNEIFTSSDPVRTAEFVKTVKSLFTRFFKVLTLITLHTDSEAIANWFSDYTYLADGLIIMGVAEDPRGGSYRFFQVRKFRGTEHCTERIVYRVESGRIM